MSQLEKDLEELGDAVITNKDLKAALQLLSEVLGAAFVAYLAFIFFTVWIPGIGIPISGAVCARGLYEVLKHYSDLPTDQRRAVALVVRKLHTLGLY
jgi:hypothetical protein